ncbi:unnamed protein product [Effrenium voratum]|uniref:DUF305 domain-containing protein n=1 Tax=Effrenium voratum TaxID=2562239 RepID=A0AA36J2J6_9DINO|nr:unnamed protein product [Effrenium voratum]
MMLPQSCRTAGETGPICLLAPATLLCSSHLKEPPSQRPSDCIQNCQVSLDMTATMCLAFTLALAVRTTAACVASATHLCMKVRIHSYETGYYQFEGYNGDSPDLEVRIGQTYVFDQTDSSNWYHAVGFAYYPDGAHGADWGGDERDEVEGAGELLYKIDGAATTCPDAGNTGLDCYEPEFFYPRADWMAKNYTAELTITQMSGKIVIKNADGSAVTQADGQPLVNAQELPLYSPVQGAGFDVICGTSGASDYAPGGSMACPENFLGGTLDTDFEKCMQAIDCKMNKEMRIMGFDSHQSHIVTFMQQMIPHHANAVNMAKIVLKFASPQVVAVEDLSDILWSMINAQNYQIHVMRNYLGSHTAYGQVVTSGGSSLSAESVGEHCNSTLDVAVDIQAPTSNAASATAAVPGCSSSANRLCMKVNLYAGETGYFEFAGYTGPSPDLEVRIGQTYVFDQTDGSNWYHAVGFAYYPDGAHGADWGGDERDEVEGAGELLYKIDGAATTCPDAGNTGLDCYEPEFFYPRADWMAKNYTAELTITQAMADRSQGGVIYYFCHIHSKMSGKIVIKNADGSAVTQADGQPLVNAQELPLYSPATLSGTDLACGTAGVGPFAGGGERQCAERFLCGNLDTTFERCMQAIDCKMKAEMLDETSVDHGNQVAVFMQQMIPHHLNAVNMAKILLKHVDAATIDAAIEEQGLTHMLNDIINVQNFQVHQFRNYLAGQGLLPGVATTAVPELYTSGHQRCRGLLSFVVGFLFLGSS